MPLIAVYDIAPDVRIGLWDMTEKPEDCGTLYDETCRNLKSASRRQEYVCVRLLLRAMTGSDLRIMHEQSGRPYLDNGLHISISHTRGICAIITSRHDNVAIDIERHSDKVNRVAGRFLRSDETARDTTSRLIHWCAKETAYKLFSADRLTSDDIRVVPFEYQPACLQQPQSIIVHNTKRDTMTTMSYAMLDDAVITFAHQTNTNQTPVKK